MFDTSILEVVIGLFFVFSLIAILVTQVNGLLGIAFNLRGRVLKKGLYDLITDPKIRAKLLGHPVIDMVEATVVADAQLAEQDAEQIAKKDATKVTYIPPQTFVEALMGILITEADKVLYSPLQKLIQGIPNALQKSQLRELTRQLRASFDEETLRKIYEAAQQLSDEKSRDEILKHLESFETSLETILGRSDDLVPLFNGVSKIADESFRSALQTILISARSIDEARIKLESWFTDNMDRVSERFKRLMHRYSILVAATIVIVLNIDTLFLAQTLWNDEALRANIAAAARNFDQSEAGVSTDPAIYTMDGEVILITEEDDPDNLDEGSTFEELQNQSQETQQTLQTLIDLQLPIGWRWTPVTDNMIEESAAFGLPDPLKNSRNIWNFVPGHSDSWLWLWVQKIIGILLTTLAASQGAPFWFDLLNKITRRG